MDALEAIFTRRSIRKYKSGDVSDEQLHTLLDAAMCAPSAGNAQPWHFVVIKDRELLNKVPDVHHHSKMLKEASLGILVCADPTAEKYEGRWMLDCSAATENMLIAANAIGLGAVWLGFYPVESRMEGIKELLQIPGHIMPVSLVSIGYPLDKPQKIERFDEKKVHYDLW